MAHAPKVLTLGKASQDVFLGGSIFRAKSEHGVPYEHLALGAKLDVETAVFATGGNATNAAVTFARGGLHAQYLWALGHDDASQAILADLDREDVDTSGVVVGDGYSASYSAILLAPNGERTILNYHGKMPHPSGAPLELSLIDDVDWLYISSLGSMELLEKVVSRAARHNTKIAMNPAATELAEAAKLKGLLEDVDVLLLNKEEMTKLVHGDTLEELVRHGTHYCQTVVVSDGPRGVMATDGKEIIHGGLYEDVKVVDRTGAGDAFGSGFVSKIAQGASLREAIVFASANSTSVVTKIGAKEGILRGDVELHDMPLHIKPF